MRNYTYRLLNVLCVLLNSNSISAQTGTVIKFKTYTNSSGTSKDLAMVSTVINAKQPLAVSREQSKSEVKNDSYYTPFIDIEYN